MGIAENHGPASFYLLLEVLEIYLKVLRDITICGFFLGYDKRRVHDFAVRGLDLHPEGMIYRRHYQHLVSWLCKAAQRMAEPDYNSGNKTYLVFFLSSIHISL